VLDSGRGFFDGRGNDEHKSMVVSPGPDSGRCERDSARKDRQKDCSESGWKIDGANIGENI
jgi:hypothetical protein